MHSREVPNALVRSTTMDKHDWIGLKGDQGGGIEKWKRGTLDPRIPLVFQSPKVVLFN